MKGKHLRRLALGGLATAALAVLAGFAWLFWRDYRSPTQEEVLRWLPADTEAVARLDKPVKLSPEEPDEFLSAIPFGPIIVSQDLLGTDLLKLAKCTAGFQRLIPTQRSS